MEIPTEGCLCWDFFCLLVKVVIEPLVLLCVKTRKQYAPKGQKHIAQGSALGVLYL